MALPFDHIASSYDSIVNPSAIGKLQRKSVWTYVEQVIPELEGFEVLELNCGAGEDAALFGDRDFNLIATDIGREMLKITQKRAGQYSMQHAISSHYLDLDSFNETLFDKKFDLVFSNFGGLNCVHPESVRTLFNKLPGILKPGGRFIGVVMPRFCAWETIFFLLRLQFKKAFRRLTSREVMTDLNGANTKTWFYHPAQILGWSKEKFRLISLKPVGIALPPSYLDRFFSLKKHWVYQLNRIERRLTGSSLFSGMADHFVIDLQVKV